VNTTMEVWSGMPKLLVASRGGRGKPPELPLGKVSQYVGGRCRSVAGCLVRRAALTQTPYSL
jgi:hypothetical protein